MTEQVSTESETVEEAPLVFPDEMSQMSYNMINDLINQRNANVAKINAVKGDRQSLSEQLEENSTNPDAVAARTDRDEAQAILDEAVMTLHGIVQTEVNELLANAEASSAQIEESIKDLDAKIKPATTFFRKMYGENFAKRLNSLVRLKGFSTKGAGSSGRRIRGYEFAATVDGEVTGFENLASAAKFLEVPTATLQEQFFDAAGNPEKLVDAPDDVRWEFAYDEVAEDETVTHKTAFIRGTRTAKDEEVADEEPATEEATV